MTYESTININSREFARRLAAHLRVARERGNLSTKELAARSNGVFKASTLEALEAGHRSLANLDLAHLSDLYHVDLDALLQPRMSVMVRPDGMLTAGAVSVGFDPADSDSLLLSYLRLVRDLRNQRRAPVVALRREDVESLASYLQLDGAVVVERLGKLMGFTRAQRRTMTVLFAAGAGVIMAATTVFAVVPQVDTAQVKNLDFVNRAPAIAIDRDSDDEGLPGLTFYQDPDGGIDNDGEPDQVEDNESSGGEPGDENSAPRDEGDGTSLDSGEPVDGEVAPDGGEDETNPEVPGDGEVAPDGGEEEEPGDGEVAPDGGEEEEPGDGEVAPEVDPMPESDGPPGENVDSGESPMGDSSTAPPAGQPGQDAADEKPPGQDVADEAHTKKPPGQDVADEVHTKKPPGQDVADEVHTKKPPGQDVADEARPDKPAKQEAS